MKLVKKISLMVAVIALFACTFAVASAADTYKVTASAVNGRVTPTTQDVKFGEKATVELFPDEGYVIDKLVINGFEQTPKDIHATRLQGIYANNEDIDLQVVFRKATDEDKVFYTVTATAENGTVTPPSATVEYGEYAKFTLKPDSGYIFDRIIVNGEVRVTREESGNIEGYSYMPSKDSTVEVKFVKSDDEDAEPAGGEASDDDSQKDEEVAPIDPDVTPDINPDDIPDEDKDAIPDISPDDESADDNADIDENIDENDDENIDEDEDADTTDEANIEDKADDEKDGDVAGKGVQTGDESHAILYVTFALSASALAFVIRKRTNSLRRD